MKPQNLHAQEDRLLDFAYGELPPLEARAVESHLEGCARCSELLAGIRGVRATMSQLPMEPAPDAGLESLLAYAQQAARNAAAGPAPKPTWWRRWLVPLAGVTAVTVFGIVTLQVKNAVDLRPELASVSAEKADAPAAPSEMRAPAPMQPPASTPPVAQAAPSPEPEAAQAGAVAGKAPAQLAQADSYGDVTPPPPAPAAKLDGSLYKEAPRKKAFVSGTKGGSADWSNAGAGAGFERSKAAEDDDLSAATETVSEKKAKNYNYDRRDAMTQGPAFPKSKPVLVGSAQGGAPATVATPAPAEPTAPAAAQPALEEAPANDGMVDEGEAQAQQEAPSRGSLRITRSKVAANKPAPDSAGSDGEGDFDALFGSTKTSTAKREQRAPNAAPPPPMTSSAPMPAPMPSVGSSTRAPSMPTGRSESKDNTYGPSSAELSKLADEAFRSGDRGREAQLLRQALNAGATGKERQGLLNRLCDAEFAIGRRDEAFAVCKQLIDEDPRSSAAQVAKRRLSREAAEANDAKPGARGPAKAAPADKMEAPAAADVKQ